MDCCDTITDLGCVNFCGTIETGVNAPSTGTFVIELVGGGGYVSATFTSGQEMTFENPFNEDKVILFKIRTDAGTYVGDCYQVKITSGIDLT